MISLIVMELHQTRPPKLLEDRFLSTRKSLVFEQFHYMFKIFDRKLQQYIEADLINYNNREWFEEHNPKKHEEYKEPFKVLTLGELEAGFAVCMAPLVLSILVFLFRMDANCHRSHGLLFHL